MIEYDCEVCGAHVRKAWSVSMPGTPRYCSRNCKAEMQRRNKPVDKNWLYQKYVIEELDCTAISKIVDRNPKQVWQWLKGYNIPTRQRGYASTKPFRTGEPSKFLGHKHSDKVKEQVRQARLNDGRVPYLKNGVHHLKGKRGADTPNWKGGITPDRQAFYDTKEWKRSVQLVWSRDKGQCQRCGKRYTKEDRGKFDIHHIVSFEVIELRCELSNLVLLCEECHYWVHSNNNTMKEFIHDY